MDRRVGEVEESGSSPSLTDEQRVLHPENPMSPKTVAVIARARALEEALSRRDDPTPATPEPQVITNAGVDEGVPPKLLRPENRQHLSDRSRQTASQPIGAKREREAPAPRMREQLLALRYWTREEYRAHLRQSRMPGPGAPQCDKCPVVLLSDSRLARQLSETEFEGWLHRLGYPERLQHVRRDSDRLRDHVWGLPGQICRLGDEVNRLRDRCSQGEEIDGAVRQDLGRHLAWIRSLYDRVGRLETQDARRVAALAAAPTPSPAQVPSELFVRVMADAFRQYSATQSTPQAQQPPPGNRA
ncbi:unnamed protein product [Phytophthora fragariaefolia]|uniref:Unnamed protein product n=1 Tax=Phytophthora fragariaefolia TaxID=1490495 RepID=A0A9W7CI23_9STRA|nr:unnamed protein product [Phytophthora fragariaefolia]